MEQSAIREYDINEAAPDFASLHPGYDADLPDGLFGCLAVQPHLQKYFGSRRTQIRCISIAVSFRQEGRSRVVTSAGRDAVDARASGAHWQSQGEMNLVSDQRRAR